MPSNEDDSLISKGSGGHLSLFNSYVSSEREQAPFSKYYAELKAEEEDIEVRGEVNKEFAEKWKTEQEPIKCNCDMTLLMRSGCQCKGV